MVNGPVLVTGATGGLGRILVQALLQQGRQVIATGRNRDAGVQLAQAGAHFVPADLVRDDLKPLVAQIESVFHLAALSSPWGPETDFRAVNLHATQRLLSAAQAADCRRFIYTSTPSIYTQPRHQLELNENSPLPRCLVNAYARSKFAAEAVVRSVARPGFATIVLRPRALIGPYDTVLLPRLLRAAAIGRMPLPGYGKALIEPTDSRDVARALLLAEQRANAFAGRAFNVSGGMPLPLETLANAVFSRLGREVRMVPLPAPLVLAVAGALELAARLSTNQAEPLLTRYGAMALGWSQTFNLSAVRDALNWRPEFTLNESLDWALAELSDA